MGVYARGRGNADTLRGVYGATDDNDDNGGGGCGSERDGGGKKDTDGDWGMALPRELGRDEVGTYGPV